MKQSFSITTSTGQHLHLISYYSRPQPGQPELPQPTGDPSLRAIVPVKGMYPESSMGETNQTPALTRAPMQQPPFMVTQHPHPGHPHYPPHYAQPYGWPPSPAATPPYHQYSPAPYPGHHALPPPHMVQGLPTSHYPYHTSPALSSYDRPPHLYSHATLPPYHALPPTPAQRLSPPGGHTTSPSLQFTATAAVMDPRPGPASARLAQGPLPALVPASGAQGCHGHPANTPPTRALSQTPPRSSHSEGPSSIGNKASLSALLHPLAIKKEEGSANSSPKSNTLPPLSEKIDLNQDQKALRMLDRKFCL